MTISTLAVIKDRIEAATEESKIALFKDIDEDNRLAVDAVFDSIYDTQKRKSSGRYIGSYYGINGAVQAVRDARKYLRK